MAHIFTPVNLLQLRSSIPHPNPQVSSSYLPYLSISALSPFSFPIVHAYIVCDKDEYFFNHIDTKVFSEMGVPPSLSSRNMMQITNAQGTGYARSTAEELEFIKEVACTTGVILDPVYSGKALYHLIRELNEKPDKFAGRSILFVHTGGLFGLYDKTDQMQHLVRKDQVERFTLDEL